MSRIPLGSKMVGGREMKIALTDSEMTETGFKTVVTGHRRAFVEVWVDVDALLAKAGGKAMRNRNKTSVLGGGAIVLVARGCADTPTGGGK